MSARLRLRDRAGATFLDHWEFELARAVGERTESLAWHLPAPDARARSGP